MLALIIALSLAAVTPRAVLESPCGIPGSRQLIAFNVYADKTGHVVEVDPGLSLEVHREEHGPVIIRRAPDGEVLYALAPAQFDGFLRQRAQPLSASSGTVIAVAADRGTLFIDPSSTLSTEGAWIFLCWKPREPAAPSAERHQEIYSGTEQDADTGETFIRRTDGSKIALPFLRNQVEIEKINVSADGKKIGWLVDEPNVGYPIPRHLVIFANGRIQQAFLDEQCIFEWAFARGGTAVSYWISALHGTDYQYFRLRDIASGKELAHYAYPSSSERAEDDHEAERAAAIAAAPRWVRKTPRSGTD